MRRRLPTSSTAGNTLPSRQGETRSSATGRARRSSSSLSRTDLRRDLCALAGPVRGQMGSPRDVVLAWVDAFNRRDAPAAAALYHDDAVNTQVAAGGPTVGRQA